MPRAADYVFRLPTAEDCENLANNMRMADENEVIAAIGRPVNASDLMESVAQSPVCVAVDYQGHLLCIGGAARKTLLSSSGIPWMLGTHDLDSHGRLFMLHGKRCVNALLDHFGRLENYVDARNHRSIRWLRRMGFVLHDPVPYGSAGLPFHRFTAGG